MTSLQAGCFARFNDVRAGLTSSDNVLCFYDVTKRSFNIVAHVLRLGRRKNCAAVTARYAGFKKRHMAEMAAR